MAVALKGDREVEGLVGVKSRSDPYFARWLNEGRMLFDYSKDKS
jgi:hypothetical protein